MNKKIKTTTMTTALLIVISLTGAAVVLPLSTANQAEALESQHDIVEAIKQLNEEIENLSEELPEEPDDPSELPLRMIASAREAVCKERAVVSAISIAVRGCAD